MPNGRKWEACEISELEPHVINIPSNPTEAFHVDKRIDGDHSEEDSSLSYDTNGSATESMKAHLLQCTEMLLQISRSEGRRFVDDLLLTLQTSEFIFSSFCEVLKSRKYWS